MKKKHIITEMSGSIIHVLGSSFLIIKTSIFQTSLVSFLFLIAHTHSVSFSFPNSNHEKVIDYRNDASISGGTIVLSKSTTGANLGYSVGRASYINPVRLWDKRTNKTASFSTHFSFNITQIDKKDYGDGFAFFVAPFSDLTVDAPPKNSFGSCLALIGGVNPNDCNVTGYPFVAVEFDTFPNSWDPKNDHLGIDVNSVESKVVLPVNGGLTNRTTIANAWINYDSSTKNLSVYLTFDAHHVFNGKSNLSYIVDMRDILPEKVRVGFTATTGLFYELHTILSWDFNSTLADDDIDLSPSSQPPIIDTVPRKSKAALVGGLVAGTGVLTIGLGLIMWRRRESREGTSSNDDLYVVDDDLYFVDDDGDFGQETGPKRFTYNELSHATNNFSEEGKLGEGGFGGVYRGFSTNLNREVAVKKISRGSRQGKKEFVSEVKVISRLRHKNLVQLLGWCHEGGNLLLVYEFMPNGSLDSHLYTGMRKVVLPWTTRYKIAQDLASALLYLHQDWEQCVLHRDIKSSNVMLDSNYNAKLGDFGLARLVDHNLSSQTTVLAGTLGYLAPECMMTGKSSKESDVYSFGVVALEIACGRRPVETKEEPSKVNMVEWVRNLYEEDRLLEAVDDKLEGEFDSQQTECLMIVGLWCCHPEYSSRPSIRQVINVLSRESPLPSLPMKFLVVPIYCFPPMNVSSSYATASSSGITDKIGATNSSSKSYVSGSAALLSDNVIV